MKILVLFIALLIQPISSIACSPPAIPMSDEELVKWNYANPCPLNVDMAKYEAAKASCLKENAQKVDKTDLCSRKASESSERKIDDNK